MRAGLPEHMDTTPFSCASNQKQPQATSTATAPAPVARANCSPISPLTTDPETDTSAQKSSVLLERSPEIQGEEQLLDKFLSEDCGCKLGPKDPQCCLFLERCH